MPSNRQRRERMMLLLFSELMWILSAIIPGRLMPRQTLLQKKVTPRVKISGARALGADMSVLEHAHEEALESSGFALAEPVQKTVGDAHGELAHPRVCRATSLGELEVHEPPVLRTACAADQTLRFKTIEHASHRSSVVGDALAEIRRRSRPLGTRQVRDDHPLRRAQLERPQAFVRCQLPVDRYHHLALHESQQCPDTLQRLVSAVVVNVAHAVLRDISPSGGEPRDLPGYGAI